jgi:hypothetical protein
MIRSFLFFSFSSKALGRVINELAPEISPYDFLLDGGGLHFSQGRATAIRCTTHSALLCSEKLP